MALSDYFNYLSVFSTVLFLVALLVLIPLGIYLCRYKLKFIIVAVLGLIQATIYLSQILMLVVNYLKNNNHNTIGLILQYALPVGFFIMAGLGIARWGLQINVGRTQPCPLPSVAPPVPFKARLSQWWHGFQCWITGAEGIGVSAFMLFVLVVYLIYIWQPVTPNNFDEVYYIPESIRFLKGQAMKFAQVPPLSKWLIASGIFTFGNNPLGWRIMSVVFSLAGIFIVYLIIKKLTAQWPHASPFVPLLGTFLLATENLTFVMGHVGMPDVFYVTFMLLAFLLYLRGYYLSCGVLMGLSLLCKVTAVLGFVVILLHWVITRRREIVSELHNVWDAVNERAMKFPLSGNILKMFKLLVAAVAVWLILIVPLEYGSMHQFSANTLWYNPFFRAVYILWYPLHETVIWRTVSDSGWLLPRTPWQWLLTPSALNIDIASGASAPRYLASIGWNIWVLIIPSICYLVYLSFRVRDIGHHLGLFLLCWLVGIYGLLVVLQPFTGRLTYDFYFYPAVPAVCITIAWGSWRLWEASRKRVGTKIVFIAGLSLYLLASLAVFVIMSPLGTNLVKLPL